jgi:alkaline phosphatase D
MLDPDRLRHAIRQNGGVSRRLFLAYAGALSATPFLSRVATGRTLRRPSFQTSPFTLGVTSGDPSPDGFVLWTRLAPSPLEPGGGMTADNIEVPWELATDEGFTNILRSGTQTATPQLGHSVHVELSGLEPNRWYFYRFHSSDGSSQVGRARTIPSPTATPDRLRFAFASCQHFESGFFTAYEHMAKDDLDLVVHLGDYIYEGPAQAKALRQHSGDHEIKSLEDYRIRHAQYKSDQNLQAAHAACPWLVTWDDHELDNNYADHISEEEEIDPAEFLIRRANAYQAYYENMPLRSTSLPRGPHMQLYREIPYGRLLDFLVLDTRQYRTDQPNGDKSSELNEAALHRDNTLLGAEQKGWLQSRLISSTAKWNVLAQQVMMGTVGFKRGDDDIPKFSMDQWPGYLHERNQLMQFLADRKVPNPVVLTGDIHSSWVNDLRVDDREYDQPIVAAEFVGTSISSGGNGRPNEAIPGLEKRLAENPCVRFFNAQRGYVRCEVSPDQWRSDYQVVEEITVPGGPATTKGSFIVDAGKPGVQPA